MKIEIKEILDANTVRITTPDERWYQYPKTKEWFSSSSWISSYCPSKELAIWMAKKGLDEAELVKQEAGAKGSRIHKGVEILACGGEVNHNDSFSDGDGEIKEISFEEYRGIISFKDWCAEAKPKFLKTEQTVFNEEYKYAGTLDAVADIGGVVYLLDYKTSSQIYDNHLAQLISYFHADGIKADKMAILQLDYSVGGNKRGWKFTEIKDEFELFLHAKYFWERKNKDVHPFQKDYPKSIKLGVIK